MQARFVRISELIEAVGLPNVREPHVKHVRDSIWEIRLKGKAGPPNNEIEIAMARAKELVK